MAETLYCRQCGTKISAESNYCPSCGADQPASGQPEQETEAQRVTHDAASTGTGSTSAQETPNQGTEKSGWSGWISAGLAVTAVLGLFITVLSVVSSEESTEENPSLTFSSERIPDSRFEVQWQKNVSIASGQLSASINYGIVFVGSDQSSLRALRSSNGEKKWRRGFSDLVTTSPVVKDGIVYVGTDHGITALHEDTGKEKWRARTGETANIQPLVKRGTLYLATESGSLYAFDAEDGEKQWRVKMGNEEVTSLAYAAPFLKSDQKMVFAGQGKVVAAFNGRTGEKKWAQAVQSGIVTALEARGQNALYAGISAESFTSGGGDLYSFDSKDGDRNWHIKGKGCDSIDTHTCNIKYLSTYAGVMYAKNSKVNALGLSETEDNNTVNEKWSVNAGTNLSSAEPVLLGSMEKIIIPDVKGIHSVDTNIGENVWSIYIDDGGTVNPAVGNGNVYAITNDKIYAIDGLF